MICEYKNPNEVKRIYDNIEFIGEELEDFASVILVDPAISKNGKIDFAERFLIRYLKDSNFRDATKGCVFLFGGREYIGLYWNDFEAIKVARDMGYKGYEIHLVPMIFTVYGEKKKQQLFLKEKLSKVRILKEEYLKV